MNDNLTTSLAGLQFIEHWEGCVLKPYKDVAGLRTIGIGYLIKPTDNFPDGVSITKEKAYELLASETVKCEKSIKSNIKVQITQNMFDALVSFGFNCGIGVYSNSGVARETNAGNFSGVPERLLDWCKAKVNGQTTVVKGLYDRRKSEGEFFLKGSGINPVWSPNVTILPGVWVKSSIADAQMRLKKLGIYKSSVDGLWGPNTSAAIIEFAKQKSISVGSDLQNSPPLALLEALSKI